MKLLKTIYSSLDKVKAENVLIYDMKGYSPLFDYVVIATVDSKRQAEAVTSYLKDDCQQEGFNVKNIEGKQSSWVLVDCTDILVHVFTSEERENFNLERLYQEVPQVNIKDIK
ncbi:MAG: ribosome silencing factor [Anaeroplasmataceae bacterium]